MNYEIRKIKDEDLSKVQDIASSTIRSCYSSFFTPETIDYFINSGESDKEFRRHFKNCYVLVDDEKIVGFNIFFDNFIHLMMVNNKIQRKGYGKILLEYAEKQIIQKGFSQIKLETFKENTQAVSFYLKNGWTITSEKKEEELGVTRIFLEKSV